MCALGGQSVLIYQHLFGYSLHWVRRADRVLCRAGGRGLRLPTCSFALRGPRGNAPPGHTSPSSERSPRQERWVTIAGIVIWDNDCFALTQKYGAERGAKIGVHRRRRVSCWTPPRCAPPLVLPGP